MPTSDAINQLVNRMEAEPGKSPFEELVIDALVTIRDWHLQHEADILDAAAGIRKSYK